MKTIIHKADNRGYVDHGWLKATHSFSFATFYDPERVQFGMLRVLNDDTIEAGMGFGKHPHENMEIITIPLKGELAHEDSMGEQEVLRPGQIQVMSAGTGIWHSEFNYSKENSLNLLQIWILTAEQNAKPRYLSFDVDESKKKNQWYYVVEPKEKGGVWIYQDARMALTTLEQQHSLSYNLKSNKHGLYLFVIEGSVQVAGHQLLKRDAIGIEDLPAVEFEALEDSEVLAIEVPM
jgi:redox-sensitive bicupin YhaK (pirin superfamily)